MKADLHIHSTVSDGALSIEEIIQKALKRGLDCIAVTDHDTVSHLSQISRLAPMWANTKLQVLGGIEISAVHKQTNTRVHVLGYHIKNEAAVAKFTQPTLEARNANSIKQAQVLMRHGFQIDMEQLKKADGHYLYKQHIMDWLVSTSQAEDMFGAFYQTIFKNGGVCDFDIEYPDVFEAVKTIKEAGGLAVLAHPAQQQNFFLVPQLVKAGLDGMELNHHSSSAKDQSTVKELAQKFGLFMTGGSDYHGRFEPQPYDLGDFLSDESGTNAICRLNCPI